jgi:hypothetical protein
MKLDIGVNFGLKDATDQDRNMDLSEFAENYTHFGDDDLLCLWADRNTLVPEAAIALDSELQRRGLNKKNATRLKKRFDRLAARLEKGPLSKQVAMSEYERDTRHFVGWKEPEFYPPYTSSKDIRNTFAYIRHTYRVWKAFRDHTGHWPVFSIWFHFLSWIAVFSSVAAAFVWTDRRWESRWSVVVFVVVFFVVICLRDLGARLMRKLDWKRCSS